MAKNLKTDINDLYKRLNLKGDSIPVPDNYALKSTLDHTMPTAYKKSKIEITNTTRKDISCKL